MIETTDISALLSAAGQEYIDKYGVLEYLSHMNIVIRMKLAKNAISETAARVARSRAEAIAMCIIKK